ncbi:MAG: exosortase V [Pseudomonadota bacterium]
MMISTLAAASKAKWRDVLQSRWPLWVGLALLGIPSLIRLGQEAWTVDTGVHGPIVLATAIWLLYQAWPEIAPLKRLGNSFIAGIAIIVFLAIYAFGRAFSFLSVEIAAFIGLLIAVAYLYLGFAVLRRFWFPILYLGFVVPMPGWFIDGITAPLKSYITYSATTLLDAAGYPIASQGVTLVVAQYQLLVEDACAGLNSIVSLTAISLFYIYILHNASWRYSLLLFVWIIPAALLANLVRVLLLVLITYHFGNAAAQGFLHSTAGMIMFVVALLSIFAVDKAMTPIRRRLMGKSI